MALFARPDSDVTVGNWTVVPANGIVLYSKIDEVTPSESDYILSPNDPSSEMCEVGLSDVTDPESSSDHIIRVRYRAPESGGGAPASVDFTIQLMEDGTSRASFVEQPNPPSDWFTASYTLTTGEADSILNYANLRLRFTANKTGGARIVSIEVSWAEFEVPAANIEITPTPVSAVGACLIASVVLGSLSITPVEITSVATTVNPTVELGSTSITPSPASAIGATVNPTVQISGLEITPTPIFAIGSTVNPTVELGSTSVTPAAITGVATTVNPTVELGSTSVTPTPIYIIATTIDPTVEISGGNLEITPEAITATASAIDPTTSGGEPTEAPFTCLRLKHLIPTVREHLDMLITRYWEKKK